jgi:uncharacterized damage-inducible protein DinB
MELLPYLKRLLAYDDLANHETLRSLQAMATPPARSVRLMAHIINAEWLWVSRMRADGQKVVVWPDYGLEESERQLPRLRDAWERYLATLSAKEQQRPVHYTNSKGEQYDSAVADILMHVAMHGAYHRGQIAAEVRAQGSEPAYTDFIQGVRTGAVSGDLKASPQRDACGPVAAGARDVLFDQHRTMPYYAVCLVCSAPSAVRLEPLRLGPLPYNLSF